MINEYIIWRKVYKVDHQNGQFKILTSAHTDGVFYGMIIYYLRSDSWQDGTIHLELKHQNFIGRTEDEVYSSCVEWIRKIIPGRFNVLPPSVEE